MIRNYLLIAIRNFKRRPFYGIANILGLTVGLAACGLIGLFIHSQWSVDRFHPLGNRIYRVATDLKPPSSDSYRLSTVGRPVANTIAAEVPEVEKVVAMRGLSGAILHDQSYYFEESFFAGEAFFEVFGFELAQGNPTTALKEPYSIVISQRLAQKFFGTEAVMGESLTMALTRDTLQLKITGIAQNPPASHMRFGALVSLATYEAIGGSRNQWFTIDEYCYVLLAKDAELAAASAKISAIPMTHAKEVFDQHGYKLTHELQPVPDLYLFSQTASRMGPISDINRLYLMGTIALMILLIACINFVNLATARMADRAREVGIRKTIGASSSTILKQFLTEALLYAGIAAILAIFLIESALPYFRELLDARFDLSALLTPWVALAAILLVGLTVLLAGWYPAILQARLKPYESLKGQLNFGLSASKFRKGLVVFQFSISIILIFSTLVIFRQLDHMQGQAPGFQKAQMLVVDTRKAPRSPLRESHEVIKQSWQAIPGVEAVAGAFALPGRGGWGGQVVKPEGLEDDYTFSMEVIPVDHDYVQTLQLRLLEGRDFQKSLSTDTRSCVILNETACKTIGWTAEEAIGKSIETSGIEQGKVIGVIADYHHHGLQQEVGPMLLFVSDWSFNYLAVRSSKPQYQELISKLHMQWADLFPGYPFEYFFLDEDFDRQYQSEERLFEAFGIFAFLSIFTACMGLLGLAVYTAEKRSKEIGIRKVLGASVQQIIFLLSNDFFRLVAISLLIALPLSWYVMHLWLQDFAFRIRISWWMFALAALLVLLIAVGTVSVQAFRAALTNPVESLRDE